MAWTDAEEKELIRLSRLNTLFYTEIAKRLDRNVSTVRWKARQLGLASTQESQRDRFGKWNAKHYHLREKALKYFLKHSFEETAQRFGLTKSEMKSLMSVAYKQPEFQHLRKDKRTHDKWSTAELLFLLRHAGLQQREWIAKKIKRGNARVIKEKLMNLGVNSKTLNGMTLSRYREVFGKDPRITIDGNAGPGRGKHSATYFKIVPWVEIERDLNAGWIVAPEAFAKVTMIMADFQRWIHRGNPTRSMRRAAGVGHLAPKIKRTFINKRDRRTRRTIGV